VASDKTAPAHLLRFRTYPAADRRVPPL